MLVRHLKVLTSRADGAHRLQLRMFGKLSDLGRERGCLGDGDKTTVGVASARVRYTPSS